jgi:hypothetical protein
VSGGALLGTATAAVLLVAGCSSANGGDSGGGDCLWRLTYDSRTYVPVPGDEPMPDTLHHSGSPLGQGQFAACGDQEGSATGDRITVYPIKGMTPDQAIITQDDEIGVTDPTHVPPAVQALLATPSPS